MKKMRDMVQRATTRKHGSSVSEDQYHSPEVESDSHSASSEVILEKLDLDSIKQDPSSSDSSDKEVEQIVVKKNEEKKVKKRQKRTDDEGDKSLRRWSGVVFDPNKEAAVHHATVLSSSESIHEDKKDKKKERGELEGKRREGKKNVNLGKFFQKREKNKPKPKKTVHTDSEDDENRGRNKKDTKKRVLEKEEVGRNNNKVNKELKELFQHKQKQRADHESNSGDEQKHEKSKSKPHNNHHTRPVFGQIFQRRHKSAVDGNVQAEQEKKQRNDRKESEIKDDEHDLKVEKMKPELVKTPTKIGEEEDEEEKKLNKKLRDLFLYKEKQMRVLKSESEKENEEDKTEGKSPRRKTFGNLFQRRTKTIDDDSDSDNEDKHVGKKYVERETKEGVQAKSVIPDEDTNEYKKEEKAHKGISRLFHRETALSQTDSDKPENKKVATQNRRWSGIFSRKDKSSTADAEANDDFVYERKIKSVEDLEKGQSLHRRLSGLFVRTTSIDEDIKQDHSSTDEEEEVVKETKVVKRKKEKSKNLNSFLHRYSEYEKEQKTKKKRLSSRQDDNEKPRAVKQKKSSNSDPTQISDSENESHLKSSQNLWERTKKTLSQSDDSDDDSYENRNKKTDNENVFQKEDGGLRDLIETYSPHFNANPNESGIFADNSLSSESEPKAVVKNKIKTKQMRRETADDSDNDVFVRNSKDVYTNKETRMTYVIEDSDNNTASPIVLKHLPTNLRKISTSSDEGERKNVTKEISTKKRRKAEAHISKDKNEVTSSDEEEKVIKGKKVKEKKKDKVDSAKKDKRTKKERTFSSTAEEEEQNKKLRKAKKEKKKHETGKKRWGKKQNVSVVDGGAGSDTSEDEGKITRQDKVLVQAGASQNGGRRWTNLCRQRPWFHPMLLAEHAERLLLNRGTEGSFLIRPSTTRPGEFTLSIRCEDQVLHIKINNSGDFFEIDGGQVFASLTDLVSYYVEGREILRSDEGKIIGLIHPVDCESPVPERWFHGTVSAQEAELQLILRGHKGSFLVRESISSPGNYVLSVRTGKPKSVTHVMINVKGDKLSVGEGQMQFTLVSDLVDYYQTYTMLDRKGNVLYLRKPLYRTCIPASELPSRVHKMENGGLSADWTTQFQGEFESLGVHEISLKYPCKEGQKPENAKKNMYLNIFPYDHSRVVLKPFPKDQRESDYINANYIKWEEELNMTGHHKYYIATQGCLYETINDFWRMIWQEDVRIILMMTKEKENGLAKCQRYWPEQGNSKTHGYITVQNINESKNGSYLLRTFRVLKQGSTDDRRIYHFHFQAWPDHGVPDKPETVIQFLDDMNAQLDSLSIIGTPIVVHCSAGIGRTGTVIAIDMVMDQIKRNGLEGDIDIPKTVQMLRSQRPGMVQTEDQYQFICRVLNHYVRQIQNNEEMTRKHKSPLDNALSDVSYMEQNIPSSSAPSTDSGPIYAEIKKPPTNSKTRVPPSRPPPPPPVSSPPKGSSASVTKPKEPPPPLPLSKAPSSSDLSSPSPSSPDHPSSPTVRTSVVNVTSSKVMPTPHIEQAVYVNLGQRVYTSSSSMSPNRPKETEINGNSDTSPVTVSRHNELGLPDSFYGTAI